MLTKVKSWCGYVNIIEVRSKAKRMMNDKRDHCIISGIIHQKDIKT